MSRRPVQSFLPLVMLVITALATSPARAATFVVNSTDVTPDLNPGDTVCDDGSGALPVCTLRAAIDEANTTAAKDTIGFDIPGSGPHTIPDAGLNIIEPVVIDGYTQLGASKNTAATGSNAVLAIALEGDCSLGLGYCIYSYAPDVELRGLAIRNTSLSGFGSCLRFEGFKSRLRGSRLEGCANEGVVVAADGVSIGGVLLEHRNLISDTPYGPGIRLRGNDGFVMNNLIGTDPTGSLSVPNSYGIEITGARNSVTDNLIDASLVGVLIPLANSNKLLRNRIRGSGADNGGIGVHVSAGNANQIGQPSPTLADANRFSGVFMGVRLSDGASGNLVQGNLIGVEADGTPSVLPNGYGIWIQGASGNTIGEPPVGTSGPGAGNRIAFNRRGLILVNAFGPLLTVDNSLRGNRIWAQSEINADLAQDNSVDDDAINPAFPPDQDEGPNHLQNPPRITSVVRAGGDTRIRGMIAAQAGSYTLDFYSNPDCALTPFGGLPGGEHYLGELALSASPSASPPEARLTGFDVTFPLNALGNGFTATATDALGNTSDFSMCWLSAQAQSDLSVAVTADRTSAGAGDDVVFTVTLTNGGPVDATGVTVTVLRPAGFSDWTADPAGGYTDATGEWFAGNLASGANTKLTLTGRVAASGAPDSIEVRAVSGQGSAQVDIDLSDNESSAQIDVLTGAHLRISQTAPASANPGDDVAFVITLENDGPEDALDVTLQGELEVGLFPLTLPPDAVLQGQHWSLSVGSLARGEPPRVFVVEAEIDVNGTSGSGLEHTVVAAAVNGDPPPPSTQSVGVGIVADLSLESIRIGDDGATLEILVHNSGPDAVEGFNLKIEGCFASEIALDDAVCDPIADPPACATLCVVTRGVGALASTRFELGRQFPQSVSATVTTAASMRYFDSITENNNQSFWHVTTPAGDPVSLCGLTGIEAVFAIGLLALARRKLRGRSRPHLLPFAALLLAVAGALPQAAHALPVAFAVDTAASSASFALVSPLGSPPPVPVSLSGSANADAALAVHPSFGMVATSLQLTGAALNFSDASILLSSPPLYALTFASSGFGASLSGPPATGFPVAAGLSLFDLGGSALVFDAGTIGATGSYLGQPVDAVFDLAVTPLTSVFPTNSGAQLRVVDLGDGTASLRLSFPFSAPLRITVDEIESTVTIAGTLVLNGVASVPEPASGLLVGGGLAWLAVRRRRRRAGRA